MRRRTIRRRRKVMFAFVLCAAVLVILEGALALMGVLPISRRRDSYVGFSGNVPLFVEREGQRVTNPLKLSYFNSQSFPSKKAAGVTRIFCLGGSTTFGHPYEDSTSFCGWLRQMLQRTETSRYEVVNCGGVSYASYRIALMMEELVQYEPDLFIIYCGHNEFLEHRTYGEQRTPNLLTKAQRAVSTLRVSGLVDSLLGRSPREEKRTNRLAAEVDVILDHTDGPESYRRDPVQRAGVIAHYEESMTRIIALGRAAGAQVILVKPESNLRHFSPFKSERSLLAFADSVRWEKTLREAREARSAGDHAKAAELFEIVCQIDPHDAATLFEAGTVFAEQKNTATARQYFVRARDEDVCPLRAPSEIVDVVARLADEQNVPLIDYPEMIASRSLWMTNQPLPGDECFLDHVHPTIEAHGDLAEALFSRIQEMNMIPKDHSAALVRAAVEGPLLKSLDHLQQSKAMTRVAQVLAWAGKDEEGLRSSRLAVELSPDASDAVSQYGRMLEKTGDADGAMLQYRKAVQLNDEDSLAQSRLASALFLRNDYNDAKRHWLKAIQTTPASAPLSFRVELHVRVGDCEELLGDKLAARQHYLDAQKLDPRAEIVRKRLAQ